MAEDTSTKIKNAGLEIVYKYISANKNYDSLKKDLENMTSKQRFDSIMQLASLFIAKPKQELDMNILNVGKVTITGEDDNSEY